jgi:hypothetical protein
VIREGIISGTAFILLILYIPSVFSQESNIQEKYNINTLGLGLKYPSNWNITYDSSKDSKCEPSCLIVLENADTSNVTLSIYAKPCNCDNLLDRVKDRYNTTLEPRNITLLNDNGTKLKEGTDAWQMEYLGNSIKNNYVIWFLNNGTFYEVNYYNKNTGPYLKYLPTIKTIVNDIEFFPKNTRLEEPENNVQQTPSRQPSFMSPASNNQSASFITNNPLVNTSSGPKIATSLSANQSDLTPEIFTALIEYYPAVTIEFVSNSTIALKGDEEFMLNTEYNLTPFWKAIDTAKQFGYSLDEITESGLGSVGNPTRFYAIMSLDTNFDNTTLVKDLTKQRS